MTNNTAFRKVSSHFLRNLPSAFHYPIDYHGLAIDRLACFFEASVAQILQNTLHTTYPEILTTVMDAFLLGDLSTHQRKSYSLTAPQCPAQNESSI